MCQLIEIRMTKTWIFLTETELNRLLAREPELWALSIKRGKGIIRRRKELQRQSKAPRCREPNSPA